MLFIRLNNILRKIELIFGSIFIFSMFSLISVNIVLRYVLNSPLAWSDELNSFMFAWLGFISAAYSIAGDDQIRITIFEDRVSKKISHTVRIFTDLLTIVGIVFLFKPTIVFMKAMKLTAALHWPQAAVYSVLLIAYILFIIHSFCDIYRRVRFLKTGEDILETQLDVL